MIREDILNDEAKEVPLDEYNMKKALRKMHIWPRMAWLHSCKHRVLLGFAQRVAKKSLKDGTAPMIPTHLKLTFSELSVKLTPLELAPGMWASVCRGRLKTKAARARVCGL